MLVPKQCVEVSPQCNPLQTESYRLGWFQGQVEMADRYNGTPCQIIEMEAEIDRLRVMAFRPKSQHVKDCRCIQCVPF